MGRCSMCDGNEFNEQWKKGREEGGKKVKRKKWEPNPLPRKMLVQRRPRLSTTPRAKQSEGAIFAHSFFAFTSHISEELRSSGGGGGGCSCQLPAVINERDGERKKKKERKLPGDGANGVDVSWWWWW